VNAGCKDADFAHFNSKLPSNVKMEVWGFLALVALQGPSSEAVLAKLNPAVRDLKFMHSGKFEIDGMTTHVSRSGYTGEDGFEISVFEQDAAKLWRLLLDNPEVKPIGLGARDSLRLEAGLCLYGHDIDTTTSPVEAGLQWSIQKSRRIGGGFPGAARIQKELAEGPSRKRVGVKPEGRAIAREGTPILDVGGKEIGKITSGGFGPTVNGPVAMGYVTSAYATAGTAIQLSVRDKLLPATIVPLPFVPNNFKR
jgi:aminomethyltransferase